MGFSMDKIVFHLKYISKSFQYNIAFLKRDELSNLRVTVGPKEAVCGRTSSGTVVTKSSVSPPPYINFIVSTSLTYLTRNVVDRGQR